MEWDDRNYRGIGEDLYAASKEIASRLKTGQKMVRGVIEGHMAFELENPWESPGIIQEGTLWAIPIYDPFVQLGVNAPASMLVFTRADKQADPRPLVVAKAEPRRPGRHYSLRDDVWELARTRAANPGR